VPQTPSFGKRNELFYNNVEKFEVDLRAECSVNTSLGIFLWPCPSSKSITSYFGNRVAPKAGASTDHKGIDIGASMGESVIAAAAGRVTTVAYSGARGYHIMVDHGNGYETLYQHLSRQDVLTGDMVKAGQQIGAVGETGISTAPHLHFEVHENGTPVDPMQFFK
jgi:murein DD-endopeptidase MepM/ murein hydrolase activator NlpD